MRRVSFVAVHTAHGQTLLRVPGAAIDSSLRSLYTRRLGVAASVGLRTGPALYQRRHYAFLAKKGAGAAPAVGATTDGAGAFPNESAEALEGLGRLASSATTAGRGATGDGPSATYFDYLDRFWNRKWFGTVDDVDSTVGSGSGVLFPAGTTADSDTLGWFAEAFLAVQSALGLEAWAVIVLFGGLTRLFTLAFSFYGERATARMQVALPELKAPQEAFNKVYYNDLSSALDVQLSATALKSERRRVFAKYDTSNIKCLAPFASSPVILYGLYQVSRLCENAVLDVGTSSFFWCTALTLPDPLFVLPVVFCGLTLLNFELSISKDLKKGWMSNVIWGARLGCLCVIPVASTFRAGVCLYFIGMSVVGLLQPVLLRVPAFRKALKFPDVIAQTGAQEKLKNADELQTRMTVQFPYLSHLLNPSVEDDNEQLFKAATPPSTSRQSAQRGRTTTTGGAAGSNEKGRRYAAGTNPLMQEIPLSKARKAVTADTPSPEPKKNKAGSGKGSSFASGGWKSAHVAFTEDDFVPSSYETQRTGGSPTGQKKP